jgi:hypothetical protein
MQNRAAAEDDESNAVSACAVRVYSSIYVPKEPRRRQSRAAAEAEKLEWEAERPERQRRLRSRQPREQQSRRQRS